MLIEYCPELSSFWKEDLHLNPTFVKSGKPDLERALQHGTFTNLI